MRVKIRKFSGNNLWWTDKSRKNKKIGGNSTNKTKETWRKCRYASKSNFKLKRNC